MKRILIVGVSGTGKTRFANLLSKKLSIPVVNLDSIFWKENWVEEEEEVVKQKIADEINKEKWIIEGYIEPLSKQRIEAADQIIYLDYSGYLALWGGIARMIKHRKTPRPEMPAGNIDKFGYEFLKTLYQRQERPEIEKAVDNNRKVIRLKNRKLAKQYLESLV